MNTIYEDKSASEHFGQLIKALRTNRQFTQEDLSKSPTSEYNISAESKPARPILH